MEEEIETSTTKTTRWENVALLLLLPILALGGYLRFTGLDWDANHHLHPDERFLTIVASSLRSTSNPVEYLRTSESPLNPYNVGQGFYVYGNFPMTVTRLAAEWATTACESASLDCPYTYTAYDGIHIFGRFLSGFIDLFAILFIFLIGWRLYNWQAGLLAATLQAFAVMPIQQSHFFTMDTWASTLTIITLYCAVRAASFGDEELTWQPRWYLLFGLFLGLTIASRINVAPVALMIGLAGLIWLFKRGHSWQDLLRNPLNNFDLQRVIIGGMAAALVSLIIFRLAQPYAFADTAILNEESITNTGQEAGTLSTTIGSLVGFNPQWVNNMEEIQRLQAPEASFPPALQWTDRAPILFPLTNMILYGMGFTAALAAWFGFGWALWRIVRGRPDWMAHAIPVAWSGLYFLFMGTRWVKSIRYFLPIYPTLFLLGAWALIFLWQKASQTKGQQRRLRQSVAGALIALTILSSFLWANAFVRIYQQPVTRVAASDWIFENVPSGATLFYTASDGNEKTMQLPLKEFDFLSDQYPLTLNFIMPEDGTTTAVSFNYLSDGNIDIENSNDSETLEVQFDLIGENSVVQTLNLGTEREAVLFDFADTAVSAGSAHQIVATLRSETPIRAGTSLLANEHWDDLLPVGLDGRNSYGGYYTEVSGGQRPVTHPDSAEKRQEVVQWLDEADYIMLSSQRAIWSLPRLPLTYPMMMRYYEALFSGELGFELVAEFHATHQIGPLHISDTSGQFSWGSPPEIGWPPPSDLAAEEAFSVYDHPPVWIFAKTDSFDREQVLRLLGAIDLSRVTVMNPLEATQVPNGLLLSPEEESIQRSNGTFSTVFNVDGFLSNNPTVAAVVWWILVILFGWLGFPLAFMLFRALPGKGYVLARSLSMLLVAYLAWIVASFGWLTYSRTTLLVATLAVGLLSLAVFVRRRSEIGRFLTTHRRYILTVELLALAFYLLLIIVRLGNPDVWDVIWGGEKPMDLTYFTAVLKSTTFPPFDPWFAGGYMNYYYFGFVYVGTLTKLLGIVPTVSYNLILPMLYSMTGMGVFALAYNLTAVYWVGQAKSPSNTDDRLRHTAPYAAGFIASALAVLLGNLAQIGVVWRAWNSAGSQNLGEIWLAGPLLQTLDGAIKVLTGTPAPIYTGDWFFTASRAINADLGEAGPITEFPFFTFLYGDLHAHMIALPITILVLAWGIGLVLQVNDEQTKRWNGWETAVFWLIGGLTIGSLSATNFWDYPTFIVIGLLSVIFYAYRQNDGLSAKMWGETAVLSALLLGIASLAFYPFSSNFGTGYTTVSLWDGSNTFTLNYLSVYGLFLLLTLPYLLFEFRQWAMSWSRDDLQRWEPIGMPLIAAMLAYVLLILALLFLGYWVAPIVLTIVILAGLLGLRRQLPPVRRILLILIAAAFGLTLAVEFVVVDGTVGRMNTVFKVYMQVWTLLSIAAGVTAVLLWPRLSQQTISAKAWRGTLAILVFLAAIYPPIATLAKWDIRMSDEAPITLDGMAFMQTTSYGDTNFAGNAQNIDLSFDYDALRWMQRNIEGSPVVAEAYSGNYYRSIGNRVAMYTGLPTIIGWGGHQSQQRLIVPGDNIGSRTRDVERLYNTTQIQEKVNIINKYDVSYVYVGQLEWTYYRPDGLVAFDEMATAGILEEVYRNEGVSIYKVLNQTVATQ